MCEWFGLDHRVRAEQFGVQEVFDSALGVTRPTRDGERLWPCFCGLPMGWAWALYFCHNALTRGLVAPVRIFNPALSQARVEALVVKDRQPAPTLLNGEPLLAPYVDNGNTIAADAEDARGMFAAMTKEFTRFGFSLRDLAGCSQALDMIGMDLHGRDATWRHRKTRHWILYLALHDALRIGRLSGEAMRILAGHLCHFFTIARPALSSMGAIYVFARENLGRVAPGLRRTSRVRRYSRPHIGHSMTLHVSPVAFCSDACFKGFALHSTALEDDLLCELISWRQRWGFRLGSPERGAHRDGPGLSADMESLAPEFDAWMDEKRSAHASAGLVPALPVSSTARQRPLAVEIPGRVPSLPDAVIALDRWGRLIVGAWRHEAATHLKEARASLLGLKRSSRDPRLHGHFLLSFGDNMAEVLAFERGRAVNWELNSLCRVAASRQLGCQIVWRRRHVEFERNPSDADSRLADRGFIFPGEVPCGLASSRDGSVSSRSVPRAVRARCRRRLFCPEGDRIARRCCLQRDARAQRRAHPDCFPRGFGARRAGRLYWK